MSLLKEIPDKGAVLAWSPLHEHKCLIALGTKDSGGVGFDDYGGELELHYLDFGDASDFSTTMRGTARTTSRFSSLAWSDMALKADEFQYGLIAGGMSDGTLHVWDAMQLVEGNPDSLIASVEVHQGAVNGLQFNPHSESTHLLASGGSDREVFVIALDRPDTPNVFIPAPPPTSSKHTAEITRVAWNSQVQHILASSSQNGSCIVWDLRQKKSWCELKDPQACSIADVAWNPDQGLHLVTASGDDRNPVIKLWDLRSSTSLPLATLQGHTQGILSVSWNKTDPNMLMSCGKDNKTFLWDLFTFEQVYELPSHSKVEVSSEQMFGGGYGSGGAGRRYHVEWAPGLPGVLAACSFDRRVQVYSLAGVTTRTGRAPRWLRRPVGASFAFGGKLAYFTNNSTAASRNSSNPTQQVIVLQVCDDSKLISLAEEFQGASTDYRGWCHAKLSRAPDDYSHQVWKLIEVLCFETSAREQLLAHLGFDAASISDETAKFIADRQGGMGIPDMSNSPIIATRQDPAAEAMIGRALLVGNFKGAVECCLEAGMMAEALLLASCGGPDLWASTQAKFFARESPNRPVLAMLAGIIKSDLSELVGNCNLEHWQETLALLSTYGNTEQFPQLCTTLGNRLEIERGDRASATLCHMCAIDIRQTVKFWIDEFRQANAQLGRLNTLALQEFVEKVTVFKLADPDVDLGIECAEIFASYAQLLASQGKLDYAAIYASGNDAPSAVLRDRLYHAGGHKAIPTVPVFPFERVTVRVAPAASAVMPLTQPQVAAPEVAGKSAGPTQPVAQSLPPEWLMLTDQASGRTYYVNQATGVSQWERPVIPIPAVVPAVQAQRLPMPTTGQATMFAGPQPTDQFSTGFANTISGSANPNPIQPFPAVSPSPVGNSFPAAVTPAQPQPIQPTHTLMPATIAPVPTPSPEESKSSVQQSTINANVSVTASTHDFSAVFANILSALSSSASLTGMERKQLPEMHKALTQLTQRAAQGAVSSDILDKVGSLGVALTNRDYASTNAIVQDLVTNSWNDHKDWVKGIKYLCQLASKKL